MRKTKEELQEILKDEVIRVSFRAPMNRSELALLEYKPN